MASAGSEVPRITRIRDRAIIKRNTYASHIRTIHDLAQRVSEDNSLAPQLLAAAQDIDKICSDFIAEDDAVLDALIELGLTADYSDSLVIEIRGLAVFDKSVVRQCEDAGGSIRGSSSQDGSVSSRHTSRLPIGLNHTSSVIAGPVTRTRLVPTRLSEIPLPIFEGSIFKWPTFRDRFAAMVGHKENISAIDKVYYLLGCLKGSAAHAVSGIPVSADSYPVIWSALEARYHKPRRVAKSLLEKLINAPVSPQESLADLSNFLVLFDEGLSVLRSLRIPDLGDFILFTIASQGLPPSCRTLFEASNFEDYPPVDALLAFIRSRVNVLEHAGETAVSSHSSHKQSTKGGDPRHSRKLEAGISLATASSSGKGCNCCVGAHSVVLCPKFKGWSAAARVKWIREQRMCFRCLSDSHWSNRCYSKIKCNRCSRNHHPLIHEESAPPRTDEPNPTLITQSDVPATSLCGHSNQNPVLLGTALVYVRDCAGVLHLVRALIDSASQISAMTSSCATRLGLQRTRWTMPVTGLSGVPVVNVEGLVECQIQPRFAEDPIIPVRAWVFLSITTNMPRQSLPDRVTVKFANLALADSSFASPSPIDLLLGADIFSSVLNGKRITVDDLHPVAFGSVFGWILIGPIPVAHTADCLSAAVSMTTSIESIMDKCWCVDEPDAAPDDFTEEGKCESIYLSGTSRMSDGRFSVPLPFREETSPQTFIGSRAVAMKRFLNLERKLNADSRLRDLYVDFMREYESLGHMSVATSPGRYMIPHHAVYRALDVNPKIRVVFDASATSFLGTSLNDWLLTGPKLNDIRADKFVATKRGPHKAFKSFSSNRIHQIHSLLPDCQWNHKRSAENPADCDSRGFLTTELLTCDLYWKGPACLYMPPTTWITDGSILSADLLPEVKVPRPIVLVSQPVTEWFSRFSSYNRMLRGVAWMRRFASYCRRQFLLRETCLSRWEIEEATLLVACASQRFSFTQLYRELSVGSSVSSRLVARLRSLINSQQIICVDDRLRHFDLSESHKVPILLSKSSYMLRLIVRNWHRVPVTVVRAFYPP